jgi:hypothetical protein
MPPCSTECVVSMYAVSAATFATYITTGTAPAAQMFPLATTGPFAAAVPVRLASAPAASAYVIFVREDTSTVPVILEWDLRPLPSAAPTGAPSSPPTPPTYAPTSAAAVPTDSVPAPAVGPTAATVVMGIAVEKDPPVPPPPSSSSSAVVPVAVVVGVVGVLLFVVLVSLWWGRRRRRHRSPPSNRPSLSSGPTILRGPSDPGTRHRKMSASANRDPSKRRSTSLSKSTGRPTYATGLSVIGPTEGNQTYGQLTMASLPSPSSPSSASPLPHRPSYDNHLLARTQSSGLANIYDAPPHPTPPPPPFSAYDVAVAPLQ